jgi:hypothetical protein
MQFPDFLVMGFQGLPSRAVSKGQNWFCHSHLPFDAGLSFGVSGRPKGRLFSSRLSADWINQPF